MHADLLRVSAANPGNDHRLGANEAPPAIISIFLGDQLEDILNQIERGELSNSIQGGEMSIGVKTMPSLKKDATDRNRTSPFAFTGNKFEFRMLGSSDSIACSNYILNTMVADVLGEFADKLQGAENFEKAVMELIRETVKAHKRIVFNGNGYSKEWVEEAERRGLPNINCMVEAIPAIKSEKAVQLFEKHHVLSKAECHSRADILYEEYTKQMNIEARTMIEMVLKQIRPAVLGYSKELADTVIAMKEAGVDGVSAKALLKEVAEKLNAMDVALEALQEALGEVSKIADIPEQAHGFRYKVFPAMEALRIPADQLEMLVDEKAWPIPTYGDLLFYV